MPSSLCVATTTPHGDYWNVSNPMRSARRARALHLALGLALGLALHVESADAQMNSSEQIPPGEIGGIIVSGSPGDFENDFETAIGDFSTADLKGDGDAEFGYWTGVVFGDSTTANDPRIRAVDLGVDAQGQLGGWTVDEDGHPVDPEFGGWVIDFDNSTESRTTDKIESGSLQVDSMGAVSGTLYVEGETQPAEFSFLQLNNSRDVFAGVLNPDRNNSGTNNPGPGGDEVEIAAFAKVDPAFDYTAADLEGTWAVFVFSENTLANDPGTGHGVLEIDANGAVTGGSKSSPQGDEDWPQEMQFVIDKFGRIDETSGTLDGLGGEPVLQLAQGRQIAVGSAIGFLPGGEDDHRILFFVRKTTGVVASQLAGDFLVFSFEDDKQVNEPATGQGGVYFDPTGTQLLGGTLYWSDSPSEPDVVQPHAVDVQPDGEVTITPNALEAWGDDTYGQVSETPLGQGFTAISVGSHHSLALRTDGLIVAWGDEYSAGTIPTGIGHTAIAAGSFHNLAIDSSGALVEWANGGQVGTGGPPPPGNDFVKIDAASYHSVALRLDGTIESWGGNIAPCEHTGAPTGTGHLAISAGYPNLAVRDDGSIAAWGCGQLPSMPSDFDFTDVAAGDGYGLALRSDSSIEAWGNDTYGQVSSAPTGTGYTAIAAGYGHGLALRDDGSIDVWGSYGPGGSSAPGNDFVAIDAGLSAEIHFLALREDDSPLTFQFSPAAGMMIGTQVTEGDDPQLILAFVPEPGAALLGLAALGVLGALGRRRFEPS